jgi:hypothetical protein
LFEALQTAAAGWRTIVHVSEWSGLSIGALAAGAALVYLVPAARKLVILGAILVLVGWFCLLHGDRVGRADVHAQWADARRAAIEADRERDAMIEQNLEKKYGPQLEALQKRASERNRRSEQDERQMAKLPIKAGAAGSCELGDAADRGMHRR